tara:strand:+ start:265 stop:522 length:258 start_codon:yes stop_codon:yes gene_type:complete
MKRILIITGLLIVNSFLIIELIMIRHSIRSTTIEIGAIKARLERVTIKNESLLLEKAHLGSPYRVDIIAREQLGMVKPNNKIQER